MEKTKKVKQTRGVAPGEAKLRRARFLALLGELGLPDIEAAHLLAVHRSTWSLYHSGGQPVPRYVLASLEAFCALKKHAGKIFAKYLNESETKRREVS